MISLAQHYIWSTVLCVTILLKNVVSSDHGEGAELIMLLENFPKRGSRRKKSSAPSRETK
jgi:hypothetical protein